MQENAPCTIFIDEIDAGEARCSFCGTCLSVLLRFNSMQAWRCTSVSVVASCKVVIDISSEVNYVYVMSVKYGEIQQPSCVGRSVPTHKRQACSMRVD